MDKNISVGSETLKSIAAKIGMSKNTLKSMISLYPNIAEALKPFMNEENELKNKKVFPPNVVKIIYDTLGYPD